MRPQVELHIGVHRKGVITFLADASPIPVGSHESLIDGEAGLFADGALDRIQASFYFLLGHGDHIASIAVKELKAQVYRRADEIA